MNKPNLLIKVEKVFKQFDVKPRSVVVLKNISLEIFRGEFITIFGPSGSGKSTLLNIIMGLEDPASGDVTISGNRISAQSQEENIKFRKENIGIVYQQAHWIKSLNVAENVAFPLVLRGIKRHEAYDKALKMLAEFDLEEWASYNPSELSSGQQQKASLARALITDPEIIIADEPTGNLDYKSGAFISQYLKQLSQKGKTVIMVTHDISNLAYCDRVLRIFDGSIVQEIDLKSKDFEEVKRTLIMETSNEEINERQQKIEEIVKYINSSNGRKNIKAHFSFRSIISSLVSLFTIPLISLVYTSISLFYELINWFISLRILPGFVRNFRYKLNNMYYKFFNLIEFRNSNTLNFNEIFDLSFKNLFNKKNRALVTIGGIAVGIGFTVFLISLGYGLEGLVVRRVAELEELKNIEVYPAVGENLKIDDKTLESFSNIEHVTEVLPLINAVGNVSYQDSKMDSVVYGVQSDYLKKSDINLSSGEFFENNNINKPEMNSDSKSQEPEKFFEAKMLVNTAFLSVIGVSESEALGKKLQISFINENISDKQESKETESIDYEILGVISDDSVPLMYVPITDLKTLSINSYDQVKTVVDTKENVSLVRDSLHAFGYRTTSILDTIEEIEAFFANARIIFGAIGFVALFVASLGMFNTLTVSLLERIREIGLMKAIGMKSAEVKKLFLTEALIIGILGGFLGIALGITLGYLASLIISLVALSRGYEPVVINNLPFSAALLIIFIATATSLTTGLYPSRRAQNISALNALRYE